jgi:hypothetical protein
VKLPFCIIILEPNPLILPGNNFKGLFQYTWWIHLYTVYRASYNEA